MKVLSADSSTLTKESLKMYFIKIIDKQDNA